MRRAVFFRATNHRTGEHTLRLFWMNDEQALFFAKAERIAMQAPGSTPQSASEIAERLVIAYLHGRPVPKGADPYLLQGRQLFPALTDAEITRLRRFGCPAGVIRAVVLQVNVGTPGEEPKEKRMVCYHFDDDQIIAFNASLKRLRQREGLSRDQAWLKLLTALGRCLSGRDVGDGLPAKVRRLITEAFYNEGSPDALVLAPPVTEAELRDWAYTEVREVWTR